MRRVLSTAAGLGAVSLFALVSANAAAQGQPPAAPPAAPPPAEAAPAPAQPAPAQTQPAPVQPAPAPAPPPPVTAQPQPVPPPAQPAPQPAPAVQPPPPAQPAPAQPVQPAPAPAPEPAPAPAEPDAGGTVSGTLAPPPVAKVDLQPPPVVEAPSDAEVIVSEPWYQKLHVGAFVDTYFSMNYQTPKPQEGRNRFRAFDQNNGFSVGWAGLNMAYHTEQLGGTLELRFGPSAARLAGVDADAGLENVKQAYATWRPGGDQGMVTLDFGKFDTIVGAEAADSQLNFNYTRGYLFWLAQPFFHTGLRANVDLTDDFWITGLLANGWDSSVDNNFGKTFGLQVNYAVPGAAEGDASLFDVHVAYVIGPEQPDYAIIEDHCNEELGQTFNPFTLDCDEQLPDASADLPRDLGESNTQMRQLIDVVVGFNPTPEASVLLNADFGFDRVRIGSVVAEDPPPFGSESWWGLSLAGRYQFTPEWAGALRAEIFNDPDARITTGDDPYVVNVPDLTLYGVTATVEVVPVSGLILKLDNRLDIANEDVYQRLLRTYETVQFTTTLGAVVTTN